MSIYKRGKSWYIDIILSGKRINRKAGKSKSEARIIEETLKTKHRLRQFHISELSNEDVPFIYLADKYFIYSKDVSSGRTYQVECNFYDNHVKTYFEGFMAQEITDPALLDFQTYLKGKHLANRTVNIIVGIVRKVLKHGASRHIIKMPTVDFPHLKESRRIHAYLSEEEFKAITGHIKDDIVRARVIVSRHTGMRPAEAAYLAWDDIHFDAHTIRIQGKEIKPGVFWKVKDSEERTIPLNRTALLILKRLYRHKKGIWVFSRNEQPVVDIDKSLKSAAVAAGIKRRIAPNMLRHTFAVLQLQRGANIEAIRQIMGHSDIRTTMRYLDCVKDELRKAVK